MVGFSKYEFNNKLLGDVILLRVTLGVTWTRPYIYICVCVCMYEMSLSHIWCNSCKVTYFLHHIFLRNLMVKKHILKNYCFPLLSLSLFIVFRLKGTCYFQQHTF